MNKVLAVFPPNHSDSRLPEAEKDNSRCARFACDFSSIRARLSVELSFICASFLCNLRFICTRCLEALRSTRDRYRPPFSDSIKRCARFAPDFPDVGARFGVLSQVRSAVPHVQVRFFAPRRFHPIRTRIRTSRCSDRDRWSPFSRCRQNATHRFSFATKH